MRFWMSSSGRSGVSLGCLGMLILGPFIAAGYVIVGVIWLMIQAAIGIAALIRMAVRGVRHT